MGHPRPVPDDSPSDEEECYDAELDVSERRLGGHLISGHYAVPCRLLLDLLSRDEHQ